MLDGSRRQGSGAEAAEARVTRPAEARSAHMGAIERGRERGRVGDRGTGGSAPAVPAVNIVMHARIDLYLTFSSPLLSSLSLSLKCRDSVVPCY